MIQALQFIVIFFALFALSRALLRLKGGQISTKEFAFWATIWLSLIIVVFVPNVMVQFSDILGIGRGVDLIIYASLIVLFYLAFRILVKIESLEQEITKIVREIAINDAKKNKK